MEKGFDHLRCPMCGGELVYSEGTHDLCCGNNRYERMSEEEWEASLNEERAGSEGEKSGGYIYKVYGGGQGA